MKQGWSALPDEVRHACGETLKVWKLEREASTGFPANDPAPVTVALVRAWLVRDLGLALEDFERVKMFTTLRRGPVDDERTSVSARWVRDNLSALLALDEALRAGLFIMRGELVDDTPVADDSGGKCEVCGGSGVVRAAHTPGGRFVPHPCPRGCDAPAGEPS